MCNSVCVCLLGSEDRCVQNHVILQVCTCMSEIMPLEASFYICIIINRDANLKLIKMPHFFPSAAPPAFGYANSDFLWFFKRKESTWETKHTFSNCHIRFPNRNTREIKHLFLSRVHSNLKCSTTNVVWKDALYIFWKMNKKWFQSVLVYYHK